MRSKADGVNTLVKLSLRQGAGTARYQFPQSRHEHRPRAKLLLRRLLQIVADADIQGQTGRDLEIILRKTGVAGDEVVGATGIELTAGTIGPAENEIGNRFTCESTEKRRKAPGITVAPREVLGAQKIAAKLK